MMMGVSKKPVTMLTPKASQLPKAPAFNDTRSSNPYATLMRQFRFLRKLLGF
jgi:hypothetical protein